MTLRILDLYCCAGGASRGYARGGFEVVGVDIERYEDYPYEFLNLDALQVLRVLNRGLRVHGYALGDFTAIHASPPCQRFAELVNCRPGVAETYPDLIDPTRQLLIQTGLPYVLENVPAAPLKPTVTLCGTQFGKRFQLHRLIESNFPIPQPECHHELRPFNPENGRGRQRIREEFPDESVWAVFCREKGIGDMRFNGDYKKQAREAISPYYAEYVGKVLRDRLA